MQTARVAVAANQGIGGRRQEQQLRREKRPADYSSPVQKSQTGMVAHINADGGGNSGDGQRSRCQTGNSTTGGYPRSKIPYLPARAERQIYLIRNAR